MNNKKSTAVNYKNSNSPSVNDQSTFIPSVSLSNLSNLNGLNNLTNLNSNIAALIQKPKSIPDQSPQTKLNSLINNNNSLLSNLSNLDSFKHLLNNNINNINNNSKNNNQVESNGNSGSSGTLASNNLLINNYNNLFSTLLNNGHSNQQTSTNQLMPSILQNLNNINNLPLNTNLIEPLTPTDSPTTCNSSTSLPWLTAQKKQSNSSPTQDNQDKESLKNLTGLMTNNLFSQIYQNTNNSQADNLQQLLLMATTAQLLSMKYK